ncbi:MAG TPA: FkbM family methyltransferase [Flavisolibacter sp.]|jgi:FkbM family methyltransferase
MGGFRFTSNVLKIARTKLAGKLFPSTTAHFSLKETLYRNYPPGSNFVLIQVGANDGVSNDFLFEFLKERKPSGIAIEPLRDLYERLVLNYAAFPKVSPVNKAVHAEQKKVTLYRVDPSRLNELPAWASGIGSLDPAHHKKSGTSTEHIISEEAGADHLMRIVESHPLPAPADLLQIDVEGYDLEVLKQVDFNRLRPKIIRMEYINLPLQGVEEAIGLMKGQGYYCFYDDLDVIAVDLKKIRL